MKKIAAIAVLMLTGLSAFAAPIYRNASTTNFHKTVVVAHKQNVRKGIRKSNRRPVRKTMLRRHDAR